MITLEPNDQTCKILLVYDGGHCIGLVHPDIDNIGWIFESNNVLSFGQWRSTLEELLQMIESK